MRKSLLVLVGALFCFILALTAATADAGPATVQPSATSALPPVLPNIYLIWAARPGVCFAKSPDFAPTIIPVKTRKSATINFPIYYLANGLLLYYSEPDNCLAVEKPNGNISWISFIDIQKNRRAAYANGIYLSGDVAYVNFGNEQGDEYSVQCSLTTRKLSLVSGVADVHSCYPGGKKITEIQHGVIKIEDGKIYRLTETTIQLIDDNPCCAWEFDPSVNELYVSNLSNVIAVNVKDNSNVKLLSDSDNYVYAVGGATGGNLIIAVSSDSKPGANIFLSSSKNFPTMQLLCTVDNTVSGPLFLLSSKEWNKWIHS